MVTKVNDTVFDGTSPRVSDLDVTNFDATNGTVQATATVSKQIVNFETMIAALTLAVPAGVVVPFAGSSVPSADWIICDGQPVNSITNPQYAPLYAVIGTTYGGTGPADFRTPDLRGRVPAGLDNMGGMSADRVTSPTADSLGPAWGAPEFGDDEITLSMGEMPTHDHNVSDAGSITGPGSPHTHTGSTNVAGNHSHPYGASYAGSAEGGNGDVEMHPRNTGDAGNHSHTMNLNNEFAHTHIVTVTLSEENRGNSLPHVNMQPTIFLNYIIKAT